MPNNFKIDESYRGKKIKNPDGTFSSERTITIGIGGKFYNIPSLHEGTQLSNEDAVKKFKAGEMPGVGGPYDSVDKAVEDAKKRTKKLSKELEED